MSSIIVFSKDRPMQLHAYLESLFLFSSLRQEDVAVLFFSNPQISYARVMQEFPNVRWVKEENFHKDLLGLINASKSYTMFGCDDVVFTDDFNLEFAEIVLRDNSDIFGFSFRLGANIKPLPDYIALENGYVKWNWMLASQSHYNYPWELDCTLYRKLDVLEMLNQHQGVIRSPNYFEGDFAVNPKKYINRPNLACASGKSKAIVITVNAVQDTHPNGFDDAKNTDIFSLDDLYNQQHNKLDVKAISNMGNEKIHVGSEYFLLEAFDRLWSLSKVPKEAEMKVSRLKLFFKNIGYLFKYDLKKMANESVTSDKLNLILDGIQFEVDDNLRSLKKPAIMSPLETIKALIVEKPSFCRFGDGEFCLISGEGIAFQEFDRKLARRLIEVFHSNSEAIFIGIPYSYYSSLIGMRQLPKNFIRSWVAENREKITELSIPGRQYYDTGCTQMYAMYEQYNFDEYFSRIQEIWRNREIVIICGKTVFDAIEVNIFDCAKSVEYQYAPSKNAFQVYDKILANAMQVDKTKLIIAILGPTATVLAYDLAKHGYQALDFGHIAKDYDFFRRKVKHSNQTISDFLKPD